MMHEAMFYEEGNNEEVICHLCPHNCRIAEGRRGICGVRRNSEQKLYSENYGIISASHLDPIEKKPLYDYMSGSNIYSIGSIGCNLSCSFCQNWQIARTTGKKLDDNVKRWNPQEIVDKALQLMSQGNIGIAYTYNEPTVWFEFMYDIARLAKRNNLHNVVVSNGYINPEPLQLLLPLIDAFNIDLKGYTVEFYRNLTHAELEPVLDTLKAIGKSGKHLEIAYLVIPDENDNEEQFEQMMMWLTQEIGIGFSLHINRYFPAYRLENPPTPIPTLHKLAEIAKTYISKVYIGNV